MPDKFGPTTDGLRAKRLGELLMEADNLLSQILDGEKLQALTTEHAIACGCLALLSGNSRLSDWAANFVQGFGFEGPALALADTLMAWGPDNDPPAGEVLRATSDSVDDGDVFGNAGAGAE